MSFVSQVLALSVTVISDRLIGHNTDRNETTFLGVLLIMRIFNVASSEVGVKVSYKLFTCTRAPSSN